MKKLFPTLLKSTAVFLFGALAFAPAARAQIALVGTATSASIASGTSLTIDMPTGVVAGDVMIVNIAQRQDSSAAATSAGWTLIKSGTLGGSSRLGTILYRVAGASEAGPYTFTLTPSISQIAIGSIVAFSGVDQAAPVEAAGTSFVVGNGSTTYSASGITTVSPNAAVVMLGMSAYNSGTAPTASGWTTTSPGALVELYDNQAANGVYVASVGAAWAMKASAGATGNGTATLSASQRNGGYLIALRPFNASAAAILTFGLPGILPAVITGTSIGLAVPYGTVVTALAPTYTMTYGVTCDKANDGVTLYNFTYPVIYKVTSQDLSVTNNYTVTVHLPQTVTWDADAGTTGAQDGDGTWNFTPANWWNGSSNDTWWGYNTAVFGAGGAGPYTVTLGGSMFANAVTFNGGNYTITNIPGATLTLGGAAAITANAGAAISAPLSAGTNVLLKAGTGALTLSGAVQSGSTFVSAG